LLYNPVPHHLTELRIINCKILGIETKELLEILLSKPDIRKLSLVNANIDHDNFAQFNELLCSAKSL
jgi:hypothetical protein